MFLLDTNTLIYLFEPIAVFYELHVGIAKSAAPKRQTRQLSELMERVAIAEFDKKAALAAAQVRAKLEQQGRAIGPIDVLIAGTAISLGAVLVTHNTGEFSRVEGLNFTDWY